MALRMWFHGSLRWARNRNLFVYLDAHWNDDLPLVEELEIVFGACPNAIVMVDDFNVPFDDGYFYDDYGTCKSFDGELIEPCVAAHSLGVFYPSTSSVQETGSRRGCVVIASKTLALALPSFPLLTARAASA